LRSRALSCPVILIWTIFSLLGSPCPAWCETLSLESVLERASEHAWEIRIAEKGIGIREYGLMEARSAYYPTLSLRFDNEYVDFLGDGDSVVSVGDQVSANDASTFQHSFTLGLSYVLYDFGARKLRIANARREVALADLNRKQVTLETRLNVLDAYGQCLQLYRQRQVTGETVRLRKEVFRHLQSLREAGTVGQVRLNSAAVELAEGISLLDDLTDRMVKALENLGYFTGEGYPLDDTVFADLPPVPSMDLPPELANLPQVRSIDAEIARVQAEHDVVLREMLPTIGLTAGYRMFGADQESFGRSLDSLSARDATVGLVARWEFFSGFRDVARLNQLQLQVEQLRLEKGRRLDELQKQVRAASRIWQLADGAGSRQDEREEVLKQSGDALRRLSEQRVVDRVTSLEQQIELMEQERDMETTQLQRQLAGWQLRFWAEGQMP
jgi:outer membrane protein TolC